MKRIYLSIISILFFFSNQSIYSQLNKENWYYKIDSTNFKLRYSKSRIPNSFLSELDIKRNEIAGRLEKFNATCTGAGKRIRLNWLAENYNEAKYLISLTYGGLFHRTDLYCLDSKNDSLNVKIFRIGRDVSFWNAITKLRNEKIKPVY